MPREQKTSSRSRWRSPCSSIRLLNLLFGVVLIIISVVSLPLFDLARFSSHYFIWAIAVLTLLMAYFYWRQERARPAMPAGASSEPAAAVRAAN